MKDDKIKIEQRLMNMQKFYLKAGKMIDNLPDVIPESIKNTLKDAIVGDQELKNLMEGIESHRPPRIFLVGRTGVGKSSLVNAICNKYIAKVSDTVSCTENAEVYSCMDENRVLMDILDTRGIAESEALNESSTAEAMLVKEISEFSPDVAILMLSCTHRDDVNRDVEFLKNVSKAYEETNKLRLPILVVINKSDEMAPTRYKNPLEYPTHKIDNINEVVRYYKGIIVRSGLKIDDIIAVSSLIDWMTPDGTEISVDSIENLPQYDIDNLKIAFDGRYNIETLLDLLESSILDFEAQAGLRMAARLSDVVERISNKLVNIFAGISATVALTPIPIADISVLLVLQSILVSLIASLSGREVSTETAKEFILSMGGLAGAGFTFRLVAQQATKFLNAVFAGAGSAVSSTVAALGTKAIGKAAIAYYIDDMSMEDVKEKFETREKETVES